MLSDKGDNNIFRKLKRQGKLVRSREPWYKSLDLLKLFQRRSRGAKNTSPRKEPIPQLSKRRRNITLVATLVLLTIVIYRNVGPLIRRPAPVYSSPSAELNQRLDALFTAFIAHDFVTTEKIQSDLKKMATRGGVDEDILHYINGLIEIAKYGDWTLASDSLYEFILN